MHFEDLLQKIKELSATGMYDQINFAESALRRRLASRKYVKARHWEHVAKIR